MLQPPYGYVDLPIAPANGGKDELSVDAYYKGLSSFIASCQTPMTIAIQGDWGSGKSTALNFVKSSLGSSVAVIEFNTWLYSQFNLGESLVFSMAHEILQPIARGSSAGKKMLGILAAMSTGAMKGGLNLLGTHTGTTTLINAITESLKNATYSNDAPNVIADMKGMRQLFAQSVEEYCQNNDCDRVAILIDDLDRVEPERAIEILEGLKLFFEVPKCVFVLALDFDVVMRGVRKRYGSQFEDKKARQYFDKIIQVPFSMPVGSFNVETMIRNALERSGVLTTSSDSDFNKYLKAVHTSVGTNPRSIKRLLNSFELLQLILSAQNTPLFDAEEQLPLIVFALLCAQAAYPKLHRMLTIERGAEDELDDLLSETDTDAEDDELLAKTFGLDVLDVRRFKHFREALGLFSSDGDGALDIKILRKGIALSQVTSVGLARTDEVHESARALSISEVVQSVEDNSSKRSAELIRQLAISLNERLGKRGFGMIEQTGSNQISLYTLSDTEEILSLAPRSRPRFAGIAYSRKGLNITFGRAVATTNNDDEVTFPYGSEWGPLVDELKTKFPEEGGPTGAYFKLRPTGYPFMIGGISKTEGIETLCDYLIKIYDVVADTRSN